MPRIFFLALSVALFSCGGDSSVNVSGSTPETRAVDLPYELLPAIGFSGDLKLDLYLPTQGSPPFPAIVYISGGGWSAGDRTQFLPQAIHMASNGFVGVAIEHRLAPDYVFPAALHDAKAAVRWLRANADRYGIDPSRIGVVGASSGGHLSAMVGTTDGVAEFEGGSNPGFSSAVQAVVAFNPELDLVALWLHGDGNVIGVIEQFLGESYRSAPALWARASPLSHVDAGSAPFLLLHGTADQEVPYTQSEMMRDALIEEGVHAELFTAEGAEHGFLNRPLWQNPSLEAMKDFFTRMLR